jgi:hypothetical protein
MSTPLPAPSDVPEPLGPLPVPPEIPERPRPQDAPPPLENPIPVREPPATLPPQMFHATHNGMPGL